MKNQARIWDRLAKRYIASPIADPESYEHKLALTRKYMRPDMDVLEIGCGSGNTGRRHAPEVASYTAMDISAEMLRHAEAQGPVPDNMQFVAADFDRVDVAPESYDMVLALSVLHLLPDPAATVRKIAAGLKPGGVFVSSTVRTAGIGMLRVIAPVGQLIGIIPHLSFIGEDDIRGFMSDAGLEIVEDWAPDAKSALFLVARKPG
ncbi:methyltransferase domain-containing protein [Maritimibacter sp. DP07]|uniref:Methyltransferase domain-containing protein n=1 Tax=Maritimibacter harenae TaxID=2606218 RepID=A0A845LZA7_9RHOB|nr:class I SAM-dependent methyltransferase [Maritimibacter harenae]MZR12119.1 methyltransferase domain-containing protein [Maritimibacter harenae]